MKNHRNQIKGGWKSTGISAEESNLRKEAGRQQVMTAGGIKKTM